jgi:hypothetical protein
MLGRQSAHRGLYGVSLLLGVLAAAELVFIWLPKARPLAHVLELVQFYLERLHPSLGSLVGQSVLAQSIAVSVLIWIASWVALEAFARASGDDSLWSSISEDSCGLSARGTKKTLCTAIKWIGTLAAAPLLIVIALVRRVRSGASSVTAGFVTFDPGIVLQYMKHLIAGVALFAAIVLFFVGTRSP